jgi:hypothetical protein
LGTHEFDSGQHVVYDRTHIAWGDIGAASVVQEELRVEDEVKKASMVLASGTSMFVNLAAATLECFCVVLAQCRVSHKLGLRTDDQVLQHLQDTDLLLVMATKEAVPSATPKHLGSTLVRAPQLKIRLALLEVVPLAKLGAPEGKAIGVDSIVRGAADQAERRDVLVGVELVYDGLVELSRR